MERKDINENHCEKIENKEEIKNKEKNNIEIGKKSEQKEFKEIESNDANKLNESKNKKDENNIEKKEIPSKKPITKYSSLSPDLFSLSYISDYKCFLCGLIPSLETAKEIICCGILFCNECLKKYLSDKKECPICKSNEIKFRKIKKDNKVFYKILKNLEIKCPYKCEWKGSFGDLDHHLNECNNGFRYCKYKEIGCEFLDENKKVIEHEKKSDKLHLEIALKYIKTNKIVKKKIKFELGAKCRTTVHSHVMTYMTSLSWNCDGRKLPHGCYSKNYSFNSRVPRFRCNLCDFDLCDKCVVNYVI